MYKEKRTKDKYLTCKCLRRKKTIDKGRQNVKFLCCRNQMKKLLEEGIGKERRETEVRMEIDPVCTGEGKKSKTLT